MGYQIVTGLNIMTDIKKSPYFRQNLGFSNTVDTDQGRVFRETDGFQYFYNTKYKTNIFGQGNIGNIMFYTDHYIIKDEVALYKDKDEYIFPYDRSVIKERGINFFLGSLLKKLAEEEGQRVKDIANEAVRREEDKCKADSEKIFENPGSVNFDDLQEYLKKQRENRYKTDSK